MTQLKFMTFILSVSIFLGYPQKGFGQKKNIYIDSVVYKITFRDTIVYRYDTVHIKHYIHSDTLWTSTKPPIVAPAGPIRKGWYNPNSWGIGPMVGAYYSPFHGWDASVGFGIQYFLFAVPNFKSPRNPHMGSRGKPKK